MGHLWKPYCNFHIISVWFVTNKNYKTNHLLLMKGLCFKRLHDGKKLTHSTSGLGQTIEILYEWNNQWTLFVQGCVQFCVEAKMLSQEMDLIPCTISCILNENLDLYGYKRYTWHLLIVKWKRIRSIWVRNLLHLYGSGTFIVIYSSQMKKYMFAIQKSVTRELKEIPEETFLSTVVSRFSGLIWELSDPDNKKSG